MNFKIFFLICTISSVVLANNFHNQLIIPSVDINNPHWEFSHQPIHEKESGAFAELIQKWNSTLDQLWTKLSYKIYKEIGISIHQVDYYLNDQRFIDAYDNMYKQKYPQYILAEEDNIEDNVLNYIKLKLNYLQVNKYITALLSDTGSHLGASFGTDKTMHYLVMNKNIYTSEKIKWLYDSTINKTTIYYIEPHTNLHKSRAIETSNLLHLGISQAISSIIHQSDFFAKVLQIFVYNKKQISIATQKYGADYTQFQSYLEASLQSNNPLEVALFLAPNLDNYHQEFVLLWRDFIQDIKNCYNESDLESYEILSLNERRAVLYTSTRGD